MYSYTQNDEGGLWKGGLGEGYCKFHIERLHIIYVTSPVKNTIHGFRYNFIEYWIWQYNVELGISKSRKLYVYFKQASI